MRLPDIWTGLGFACLGGFVVLRATTFPEPAGAASPRLFPYMIGSAFVLLGLAVVARSLRARRHDDGRLFRPVAEDWMRSPRRMVRVLLIPLTIVAFGLLSPAFGTLLVATPLIFLNALAWQEKPPIGREHHGQNLPEDEDPDTPGEIEPIVQPLRG